MPKHKHFVFDTNTLVSAVLLLSSVPRQAFDRTLTAGRLLALPETMVELDRVLRRPKLNRFLTEEEPLTLSRNCSGMKACARFPPTRA